MATPEAAASTRGQSGPPRADGSQALQSAALSRPAGTAGRGGGPGAAGARRPSDTAAAYSVLGTISFQHKRLDDSIVFFKKAIQLDERLVGAHLSLAQVYMLQGEPALALPLLERALALDASKVPPDLVIKFGVRLATQGEAPAGDRDPRTRARRRSAVLRAGVQSRRRVSLEQRSCRARWRRTTRRSR